MSLFRTVQMRVSTQSAQNKSGIATHHIAPLDGLRALAIVGVLAYHTRPSLTQGGFLGVTIFFVLSGFLITRSVEHQLTGPSGLHYWRYLWKKIRRLAFPVLSLIALLAPVLYAFAPALLAKYEADALPSALFVSNIVYVVRKVSYFDAAGLPSVLTHLWFVSLLMQFYIVWPLALHVMHRLHMSSRFKILCTAVLAVLSTVMMAWFSASPQGITRAYYGLDTRLAELLVGALTAFLLEARQSVDHEGAISSSPSSKLSTILWSCAGVCLIVAFVLLYLYADGNDSMLYRGGYLMVACMSALLIVVLLEPSNLCSRVLGSRLCTHIGAVAFSLYLLHYPLLAIMNPATRTSPLRWWGWLVQFGIIWIAAELWHTFIERPKTVPSGRPVARSSVRVLAKALSACGVVLILIFVLVPQQVSKFSSERAAAFDREEHYGIEVLLGGPAPSRKQPVPALARKRVPDPTYNVPERLVPHALKVPKNINTKGWNYDDASGVCSANPLIISDSVEMGAQAYVQEHIPAAVQDNQVGRSFGAGPELYAQHVAIGQSGSVVIFALGTNGPIQDQGEIERVIDSAHGAPLYLTTVRVPRSWQDSNNALLRQAAASHSNVGILDWYGASEGHPEYFYEDGTHLTPGVGGGRQAYGQLIRRGLCGR